MIAKSVVLILGAGASTPYGYPVGPQLIYNILHRNFDSEVENYGRSFGITKEKVERFQSDLRHSKRSSIDAFLETNPLYQPLGKFVISLVLTQHENEEYLYPTNMQEDWYQYFFELVFRDCSEVDFSKNRFSIVTYNYDRSFEFAFFRALRLFFSTLEESKCYELYSGIPISHPHGMIGAPKLLEDQPGRPYQPISHFEEVKESIESIRIVSEDVDRDPVFQKIHDQLREAECIVFLGFGFHPVNLERLKLSSVANKDAQVWGTSLGFTKSEEFKFIQRGFASYKSINLSDAKVLQFIRNHLELFLL